MKTILLAGDDPADLNALSVLVHTLSAKISRGPTFVVTADSTERVLKLLGRFEIDVLIASYHRADRGCALIRWVRQGPFGLKALLVVAADDEQPPADELREHRVDAVVQRPVTESSLWTILADWFR